LLDNGASNSYTPKARPIDDDILFWEKLRADGFRSKWLEIDLYEATQTAMKDYMGGQDKTLSNILHKIAVSGGPA
jgi:hypothetical protein